MTVFKPRPVQEYRIVFSDSEREWFLSLTKEQQKGLDSLFKRIIPILGDSDGEFFDAHIEDFFDLGLFNSTSYSLSFKIT